MKIKSVTALKAAILLCMVLVVALAVGAPWIIQWYAALRSINASGKYAILISYYICAVPALIALTAMFRLLQHIEGRRPFDIKNSSYLNVISWCCLAVCVICVIGGIWYPPLYMVSAAMLFLFLTVRVVYSCFIAAAVLQEDNDLTV